MKTDRFVCLSDVLIVRLEEDGELLVEEHSGGLSVRWLTKKATISGGGMLDMVSLSDECTAYFDANHGTYGFRPSCVLFLVNGREHEIAGPVVFACWKAKTSSEAVVTVAQHMGLIPPPKLVQWVPFIHPLWPTLQ